jgi:hypothetical protein
MAPAKSKKSCDVDRNRTNPYTNRLVSSSIAAGTKERDIMASNSKQTHSIRKRKLSKMGRARKRRLRRLGSTPSLRKLLDGESTSTASS